MIGLFKQRSYSLRKSHHVLRWGNNWYKKHWRQLTAAPLATLESLLANLDQAILSQNRTRADGLAHELEQFGKEHFRRPFYWHFIELVIAIALALAIATLVRQTWFELYKIPTGSMRPSFREQDHLIVNKTAFGLNVPLQTNHFYFDPSLLKRGGAIIFSADGLDMAEVDGNYFWIFPAKKRLIKRLIGKPGDTLYFYGGQVFGIDKEGHDISSELQGDWMQGLEHIPFATFEGKLSSTPTVNGTVNDILMKQMNITVGRLKLLPFGGLEGEVYNGKEWVKDRPRTEEETDQAIQTYDDLWGMHNYAMARLLTRDQVAQFTDVDVNTLEEAPLYLELRHHPSLTYPRPRFLQSPDHRLRFLQPYTSVIPLQERHLDALRKGLYTTRFDVKNGYATPYSIEGSYFSSFSPRLKGVPNGRYEFYFGNAYSVGWGGTTQALPKDHPLYNSSPEFLQTLFNGGIEWNTSFLPEEVNQIDLPARYAYFRNGDLYLMGAPVIRHDDATLEQFVTQEAQRAAEASKNKPYRPFKDEGAPRKNDQINQAFIEAFGLKIPEGHYLVLGDNHARSQDSRFFGFIPEANIQGSPSLILWPLGSRWGAPAQPSLPWFTGPNIFIWTLFILLLIAWEVYTRYRMRHPTFVRLSRPVLK